MKPAFHKPPVQRTLGLQVEIRTPLVSVETAKAMLRVSEDEVLADIEECRIRWAFNLATPDSERAFVRIYRGSVIERQQGIRNNDDGSGLDLVLSEIFPASRTVWKCIQIAKEWNCGATHVHNLLDCGLFHKLERRYHINESPLVTRVSLIDFMKERTFNP